MHKSLVSSSQQLGWNGILVEEYQTPLADSNGELPALSEHWLSSPLGQPGHLTLVEIAEVLHISPTYFASLFKRATGISPHQYVIQQRVERAKEMLSKTNLAKLARRLNDDRRHCLTSRFLQSKSLDATV
jgi:AraC-like DNA-binding protein